MPSNPTDRPRHQHRIGDPLPDRNDHQQSPARPPRGAQEGLDGLDPYPDTPQGPSVQKAPHRARKGASAKPSLGPDNPDHYHSTLRQNYQIARRAWDRFPDLNTGAVLTEAELAYDADCRALTVLAMLPASFGAIWPRLGLGRSGLLVLEEMLEWLRSGDCSETGPARRSLFGCLDQVNAIAGALGQPVILTVDGMGRAGREGRTGGEGRAGSWTLQCDAWREAPGELVWSRPGGWDLEVGR